VRALGADVNVQPEIRFKCVTDERDVQTALKGLRLVGRLAHAPALASMHPSSA
jgi:hypothetical protein